MTDKIKISLEDLGALDKPATEADIDKVSYFVDATLQHTGGNAAAALALLVAAIGTLAGRCDEHVGMLAAAWTLLDEELRAHGGQLAEIMPRLHPRIVEAITDGEVVAPKPGWKERVLDSIDAAADRAATPPPLDTFDHVGDTQDIPEEP